MNESIVLRVTQEDPAVTCSIDAIGPNCIQYSIVSIEHSLLSCILVDSHSSSSEHTHPDVPPTVFCDSPDVVSHESTPRVCVAIVLPCAILILKQTSLVSTEPETAILRGIATHNNVARHPEALFCKGFQRLQCFRVHLDDSTIVASEPVVAFPVFSNGIDVTHCQTLEIGKRLRTHRHAVLIGSEPHTAELVEVEVFDGYIRQ